LLLACLLAFASRAGYVRRIGGGLQLLVHPSLGLVSVAQKLLQLHGFGKFGLARLGQRVQIVPSIFHCLPASLKKK
jgi:hypothetical protein